ncbi:MAG: CHAT domain-containing protein [Panacagrimonas sp.]
MSRIIVCRPRLLTPAQANLASRCSLEVNPANAIQHGTADTAMRRGGQRRLAVLIARRWPATGAQLTVQFLDNPSVALRKRILLHMNAWGQQANVRFSETRETGMVRITRVNQPEVDAGFWSYIGTEVLGIEANQPTMNLQDFTMRTPESEFLRVVRHEAGHTLGFEHEHMRSDLVKQIDRRKAIAYFRDTQNWSKAETDAQVLTPLKTRSLMGTTESDPLSIMCYQIPGEITKDGKDIPGGEDINGNDHAFAARIYPKGARALKGGEPIAPVVVPDIVNAPPATSVGTPVSADDALQIVILDGFDATTGQSGSAQGRANFARVFASYAGARVMETMRLRADNDSPTRFGNIIRIHERIKKYTNREQGTLPKDSEMIAFGDDLFETLFRGEVRRLYDEARSRQQGCKLDVVLTSMIPWIAEKPWEFAYDRTRRSFLATEEVHFVRNALAAVPAERIAPKRGPLRILVVAAQPVGFGLLSVSQEDQMIRRGFDTLIAAGLVTVETLPRATPTSLLSRVSTTRFDIVHFIGHGAFDEKTGVGSLVFENENGQAVEVPERSLREIFCGRGISLIFLNACQTGTGSRADFNKGAAQALVSHGIPALVANQYSVLDSSATSFAQHFYWALAQGMGVGPAAREARIAVNCSIHGESIDWAVPVVYARDPAQPLCEPTLTQKTASSPAAREQTSRSPSDRKRVAVWDIDGVFPGLDLTLREMNQAQSVFEFERVDLSPPLDVWDVETKSPGGTPYLWAEKLATRMERASTDVGAQMLVCITRHWMRDDDTLNIYGWWPTERKPPVVLVSFAGFDEMMSEGPLTDRALANLTVTALAGFVAGIDTHQKGPSDCPMWHNPKRLVSHLMGPQRFDAACRAKLKKKERARELEAFDSLLKAYDQKGRTTDG